MGHVVLLVQTVHIFHAAEVGCQAGCGPLRLEIIIRLRGIKAISRLSVFGTLNLCGNYISELVSLLGGDRDVDVVITHEGRSNWDVVGV